MPANIVSIVCFTLLPSVNQTYTFHRSSKPVQCGLFISLNLFWHCSVIHIFIIDGVIGAMLSLLSVYNERNSGEEKKKYVRLNVVRPQ